ncbi:MAG: PAS domain S-box protein [Methylovulum sp.]|uniref:SpoIIE family protein phosphatase n=1 Tax=Methylovulum sp. TaxID=1916980 RepID=UPI002601D440|nr:SpoIIE family protein phosphatase [Methylovulum sp.]MDD2723683.1 PAS domain S-box protein [Methylovulum sp.]MDD5123343.1 PAS domain S-box protein [Methylovulum sp.]
MVCLIIIEQAIGLDPRIKRLSPAAAYLLGYQIAELVDRPLATICANTDCAYLRRLLQDTIADKAVECELLTQAHKRLPVRITASELSAPDTNKREIALLIDFITAGQPTAVTGSNKCQEIASALTESEERFRQMADMTGEWLWEQDPQGYYIYSSSAVQQILGYTQNEVIGKHYTRFLTKQNVADLKNNADSQHAFYDLINYHRHKDGHLVFTESTGMPIVDANGKLFKWRGVDRDITAKKYFQDALIESERRTRLIIESSTNAIVIMDSYGIITDWNRQSEKIFGWSAEEAIGQNLDELIVPPRLRQTFRQWLKLFLHTGRCPWLNTLLEQAAIRRNGSEFPIELSVSPLKIGNSYIFSGFIHDITTRKAAEQQIRDGQITLAIAQSEIKIAQQIQTSLLPSTPIQSAHFEVTGFCMPADKIGGDYFDYFYHNDNCLDMVIADVSGHSIGPALFMVETRSVIRTQASHSGEPAAILGLLNHFLFEDLNKADFFITAFYLQYDIARQQLSYANAGHSPPLLLRAQAGVCELLDADGMILGVRKAIVFEEKNLLLGEGDVVLLYTDGLTEADNAQGEFFGLQRVGDVLVQQAGQSPQTVIAALFKALKDFCQKDSFNDDITLLLFKRR